MPWFVLRDLKRRNAKEPAWRQLSEAGLHVFTPLMEVVTTRAGRREKRQVPVISDLLFVHEAKAELDKHVERIPTLQYRYLRGHSISDPATVPDGEMDRFIHAVESSTTTKYYTPDQLTPGMRGRKVRIIGGPLNGYEGQLLSIRGTKTKRLLVELPSLLTAAVEVIPDFIEII